MNKVDCLLILQNEILINLAIRKANFMKSFCKKMMLLQDAKGKTAKKPLKV